MSRRRRSQARRRGRKLFLTSGLVPGIAALGYWHELWAAVITCLSLWMLIAFIRAVLQHKPRPHAEPSASWAEVTQRETELYHAIGWRGELVYVGIVGVHDGRDGDDREDEHTRRQWWWKHEVADTITVAAYPNRTLALQAEARDIHLLDPPRNIVHTTHSLRACPTLRASPEVAA